MKRFSALGILVLVLALAACTGGGDDDDWTPTPTPSPSPTAAAPTVSASANPATVAAGAMTTLTITAQNFILEVPGAPNSDGHGHYHVYLDAQTGGAYLVAAETGTVDVTIPGGTALGAHTLRVELRQNDHTALTPVVENVVNITVN